MLYSVRDGRRPHGVYTTTVTNRRNSTVRARATRHHRPIFARLVVTDLLRLELPAPGNTLRRWRLSFFLGPAAASPPGHRQWIEPPRPSKVVAALTEVQVRFQSSGCWALNGPPDLPHQRFAGRPADQPAGFSPVEFASVVLRLSTRPHSVTGPPVTLSGATVRPTGQSR